MARQIKDRRLRIKIGKLFKIDEIVEAQKCMEGIEAEGTVVILI